MSVLDRRVVAALAAVTLSVALVLVARSQAGSQAATLSTFVAPVQVTSGATALAGAKFTATGTTNSGSATHVQITLTFPADASNIVVTACPGSSSVTGSLATCLAGTVQNGQTVKMFATFTAGTAAGNESVVGNASWDVPAGGGSTGGLNQAIPSTSTFSVDAAGGPTAGKCSTSSSDGLTATEGTTGKGASLTFGTVDSSFGFPCTPAQVVIDSRQVAGATTPGSWSLLVAPLANGALAQAALTIAVLPNGITWKKAQLSEVVVDSSNVVTLTPVLPCLSGGGMPTSTADICLTGQAKYGQGVQFFVNVLGTGIDPRVTS